MATPIKAVEAALRKTGGIMAAAARELGITRQAIQHRVKKNPKLQKVLNEIVEANVDLGESKLLSAMNKGNMTAVIFYLKTKGRDRGYIERKDITSPTGGPVEVDVCLSGATASRIEAILAGARKRGE